MRIFYFIAALSCLAVFGTPTHPQTPSASNFRWPSLPLRAHVISTVRLARFMF